MKELGKTIGDVILKVVVGILFNEKGQIFIAKRPLDKSYSGLWEFPGGKIEQNEEPEDALRREMSEEIGINVQSARFLGERFDVKTTHTVHFFIYAVTQFDGQPTALENQPEIRWVSREALNELTLLPANHQIIELL